MSDHKKKSAQPDTSQKAEEGYELYYLEEKLGVSREEVLAAIQVVGNDRHKVEGHLKNNPKQ